MMSLYTFFQNLSNSASLAQEVTSSLLYFNSEKLAILAIIALAMIVHILYTFRIVKKCVKMIDDKLARVQEDLKKSIIKYDGGEYYAKRKIDSKINKNAGG